VVAPPPQAATNGTRTNAPITAIWRSRRVANTVRIFVRKAAPGVCLYSGSKVLVFNLHIEHSA
jgi:hypothetical protein